MVVGKLSPDGPSIPHLVCVKELSKVNSQAIAYFVNKGLQSLYSGNIDDSKILLFCTDAASYMVAAASLLKTFYPNPTHVTCLAHGLHRVSETIWNEFPLVNSFISNTKKCFCKAPSRISIFRENFPDIPLPLQPVVTRWGTWIQSVVYYSKYFKEMVTVIDKLPETDSAACVKAVKDCLNDSRVKNDIVYITSNFSFIPTSIEQLEREKQSLCSQIAIVKEAQVNIHSALGETGKKWNSICLELPHCALKLVCAGMVQELKRQNRHIPALSIASAINERLNCLLPTYSSEGVPADRALMFSEAARRDTFIKWPHMNYKWALPDQMAQAGFYHQPNSTGDDRAMCFTCNVCLVCWEPTDEPWSEHERHSPSCPFVKGEYTQNVPLSVTYATAPATLFGEQGEEVASIGTSSVPELFATATQHGLVAIWNTSRQLKKEVCFYITPSDPVIMRTQHQDSIGYSDIRVREAWPEKSDDAFASEVSTSDVVEIPLSDIAVENLLGPPLGCQDMELTALCIVGGPHQQKSQRHIRKKVTKPTQSGSVVSVRPSLVGGISISPLAVSSRRTNLDLVWGGNSDIISSPMVRAMNDVNEASNRESAALDIMKVREVDSGANSDLMSTNQHMTAERKKSLFLVVYDFHYHNHVKDECADTKDEGGGKGNPGQAGNSAKKVVLGTGTSASSSGTRQENNNMYQEIFLSKFLYDVPVIEDVDTDIVMAPPPECLVDGLEFPAASSSGSIYPPPTAIAAPASGGGTYDTSSVNVTFSAINGGLNMSNFPSTSDGSPPMVIKVSRVSKKDSCSSNKTSLDSMSSCQLTKRRDPFMVQCIALPDVYKEKRNLSIIGIHPTKDGGHLLVVLGSIDCDNSSSVPGYGNVTSVPVSSNFQGNMMFECSDNDSDMDVDMEDVVGLSSKSTESKQVEHFASTQNFGFFHDGDAFEEGLQMLESSNCKRTNVPLCKGSVLLVYALNFEGEVVKLDETPVKVRDFGTCGECPLEVTLLPLLEREDNGDASNNQPNPVKGCPQGMAVLVCRDGFVRIIDLATLKTVSQAVPEKKGTRFVSATYCNSEYNFHINFLSYR
ncbi:hypothetical protein ANN_17691 [Periplaneta americana]|uniref:Uncharacterized protein n=1 Tax=Periplaneta americana TaxID=6978 RepID=A0ABQ8STM5_PERAM|nr:hypothetical protein ANN_17691 [Periplaneta americana]